MHRNARLWFAGALVAALAVGSMVAAERSSSAMVDCGDEVSGSLTPEQRQQAAFAFASDERLHWHFVPAEMFARKGLLIRDMSEAQRELAHDLLKTGLSQRGYMTATSDHGSRNDARRRSSARSAPQAAAARQRTRTRPGQVLLLDLRDAVGEGHVGMARRRPSRLAALQRRQRHARSPDRRRSSASNPAEVREGPKKGTADPGRGGGCGARAARSRSTPHSAPRPSSTPTAPNDMLTMANVNITPLSPTGSGDTTR